MIETVKVKRDGPKGYHIINRSDFDPARHELFDAEPIKQEVTEPAPKKRGRPAKVAESE